MGISRKLREVLDRDYGGNQVLMSSAWKVNRVTLNLWLHGLRVPDDTSYDFLAERLGLSIEEVHRLCQESRRARTQARVAGSP